jgi:hypothetical protein
VSGLMSGEAEEGGGTLVPVGGGAQVRSMRVSSGGHRGTERRGDTEMAKEGFG